MNNIRENSNRISISVLIEGGKSSGKKYSFDKPFRVGRDDKCELKLADEIVSRNHLEVDLINNEWWITDLESANSTYVDNVKIDKIELKNNLQMKLGKDGPTLIFNLQEESIQQQKSKPVNQSVSGYIEHYFDQNQDRGEAGEHTIMIRRAYEVVKKKHSSKYIYSLIVVVAIALGVGIYSIYQQISKGKQRELAESIFYDMKTIELEIARLSKIISKSGDKELGKSVAQLKNNHSEMSKKYDEYISILDIYDMDTDEQIIVNMARNFGECDVNIPEGFIEEVKNYINKWKASERLNRAIDRAINNGYEKIVSEKMLDKQLPPHFFYLALQESNFKNKIVGPKTRYGFAKGIWQFIPKTAIKYGLKLGPLFNLKKYDSRDERFDFDKATGAAANYLNDIYNMEAQASGLLVMASYNWGEHNIKDLILKLPGNPRERNFWQLLKLYKNKIPYETYDYVFHIFSAAVICEKPKLFGFDFENPLEKTISQINK